MPACVDASFVVRLLLGGEEADRASARWAGWAAAGVRVLAPELLLAETTNALYRCGKAGLLRPAEVDEAVRHVGALGIETSPMAPLVGPALSLAQRLTLPAAYDAFYLALAERESAELWTADLRLKRAVSAVLPWVRSP
jgi:predicted nucleic acid-binding protein